MLKLILAALLSMLLPGCGIVLFPVSIPLALSQNRELRFATVVVDEQAGPLPQVSVELRKCACAPNLHVTGLQALMLTDTWEFKSAKKATDGQVTAAAWGSSIWVRIVAEGFYARTFEVRQEGLRELLGRDGRDDRGWDYGIAQSMPTSPKDTQTVVLDRKVSPQNLQSCWLGVSEQEDGTLGANRMEGPGTKPFFLQGETTKAGSVPEECIYLTVARDAAGKFSFQGTTREPKSITVHMTTADGGFIRVPLVNGRPKEGRLRTAPETGYQREMVLTEEDLRGDVRVVFYFKARKFYGQGVINNLNSYEFPGLQPYVKLFGDLFIQPDGTRNIE